MSAPANRPEDGLPPPASRAVVKARRRIVPFLLPMYVVAFLDRTNVGIAKQALNVDLGISDAVFALGAGIFIVSYALFEIPSNLILYRVGAQRWMTRIMVTWGLISAGMAFVVGPTSFCVMRLLLGIAEAGFFPGVMLYLTFWFPQRFRAKILGLLYIGYPMAMVAGNPLSGLLFHLSGLWGFAGWQWMFVVEGLLAVLMGIATFIILPNGPKVVSWLTEAERAALDKILSEEAREIEGPRHEGMWKAFTSPLTICLVVFYGLMQIGSYGVVFYLPEQVSPILHEGQGVYVKLVSAIPWLAAAFAVWLMPQPVQRRLGLRSGIVLCLVGFSGGLVLSAIHGVVTGIVGPSLAASCIMVLFALFWILPLSIFTGKRAAAVVALINSIGNLGGFFAPNIRSIADRFYETPKAGLYAIAMISIFAIALSMVLPLKNHAARGREGKEEALSGQHVF